MKDILLYIKCWLARALNCDTAPYVRLCPEDIEAIAAAVSGDSTVIGGPYTITEDVTFNVPTPGAVAGWSVYTIRVFDSGLIEITPGLLITGNGTSGYTIDSNTTLTGVTIAFVP